MAEVVIVQDAAEGGRIVADEIVRLVQRKPNAVLGLATGSTPLPVYSVLAATRGAADFTKVRGFALDEYVGLDPAHPESYRSVITREVVEPVGLTADLVQTPPGASDDLEHAADRYELAIAEAGGVDLQLLGIGTDGHIGFNEPGSSFASRTRVKTLTQQTRRDNARFFDGAHDVPTHCITQGLGTILEARHLVLLAFGATKARALAAAVEGPVTAMIPGSAVQLHRTVTVVVDEDAASELKLADYYRYAWRNKPTWQGL